LGSGRERVGFSRVGVGLGRVGVPLGPRVRFKSSRLCAAVRSRMNGKD
jgi:hypothetical protein